MTTAPIRKLLAVVLRKALILVRNCFSDASIPDSHFPQLAP
jgi:hypothetical protein